MRGFLGVLALCGTIVCTIQSSAALGATRKVSLVMQYGDSYLPLMVMEHYRLIQKYAEQTGLGQVQVQWRTVSGGAAANEELISGDVDFVSGGVGPMLKIWSASRGNVKGVAALNALPLLLNVNKPTLHSIANLTLQDKIAVPAVGVSMQAVILRMAAAKAFGQSEYKKLDKLTVTMKQADAAIALISGGAGISGHFGNSPFEFEELEHRNIHTILNSYQVLGGPATFGVVWTTKKFHDRNPKLYRAVLDALEDAIHMINANKKAAAELYVRMAHSKLPVGFVYKILTSPKIGYQYNAAPLNTMKYARFMYKTGQLKMRAKSWKSYFFPEIDNLHGG